MKMPIVVQMKRGLSADADITRSTNMSAVYRVTGSDTRAASSNTMPMTATTNRIVTSELKTVYLVAPTLVQVTRWNSATPQSIPEFQPFFSTWNQKKKSW